MGELWRALACSGHNMGESESLESLGHSKGELRSVLERFRAQLGRALKCFGEFQCIDRKSFGVFLESFGT